MALRKFGGLQPLLNLLWSKNENIQENGAGAIRNCSFNDQNKTAYRELVSPHCARVLQPHRNGLEWGSGLCLVAG